MPRIFLTILLAVLPVCALYSQPPQDTALSDGILPLVKAHLGDVAVAVQHLKSGESFRYRGDEAMPTASLIKLPVMVAVYHAAAQGELDLAKVIALKEEDKVPGSGVLTDHFSSGATLALRDYVRLMVRDSDNTATNIVIEQLGLPKTAKLMEALGLPNTKLHSKVYRGDTSIYTERSKLFGIGSTSADEMVTLLSMLHSGKLADERNTQLMMSHLLSCDDPSKLGRFLAPQVKLFHKTGAIGNCRTDAGIIETLTGPVAVCVLTNKNIDQSWGDKNAAELLCSNIGRVVVERFGVEEQSTTLRRGATGLLVESLQRTLNDRLQPSPGLGVDGDFGPSTEGAVKRFQQSRNLEPTGILNEATWQALGTLIEADESTDDPKRFNEQAEIAPKRTEPDAAGPPFVTSKAWIIADGVTTKELNSYQENDPRPPASTTKIMTAHIVLQLIAKDPKVADEVVTISQNADQTIGSSSTLRAGEQVTVAELLYGLMLPSGNDAAVAFAEHFGERLQPELPKKAANSLEAFVAKMNQIAKSLEMNSTHFVNPHGLHDNAHLTTAADLMRLTFAATKDSVFQKLVSTRQFACTVDSQQGYRRNVIWRNTNQLLDVEGYEGVKTGTTDAAGACLVASGSRDGKKRLVIILGSSDSQARYTDARNLFRWSFQRE